MKFVVICSLVFSFLSLSLTTKADTTAPGGPGAQGAWANPQKDGFLASAKENVWATIAEGILTEVYYPTIDRAQTKDTQLMFVIGKNAVIEERKDFKHKVTRYPHSLAYHVSSLNDKFQIRIEKDIMLDPQRAGVILTYAVTLGLQTPTKIYVLHNPAADNTAGGDAAYVTVSAKDPGEILAFQSDRRGDEPAALRQRAIQLLAINRPVEEGSAGYEGVNDPWTLLHKNGSLATQKYDSALNGNVAAAVGFTAKAAKIAFRISLNFTLDSGANPRPALRQMAVATLKTPREAQLSQQQQEWSGYLSHLNSIGQKLESHVLVLKGLEDKTYRGAIIAGPSLPSLPGRIEEMEWDYEKARLRQADINGGYHRVWPRDLVQMGLGLLAAGDGATPVDIAKNLVRIQLPTGRFPQNTWTDGKMSWTGYQLDQSGFPIILVSRLVELGLSDYAPFRDMVVRAADSIVKSGPKTQMERWEENGGLSPNTIAVACEGLMEASWLERGRDPQRSKVYNDTCQNWMNSIYKWTFIDNGPLGQNYFERMEIADDPTHRANFHLANNPVGGSDFPENAIIDGGFIQLFISGLLNPMDQRFASSLAVYDRVARSPGVGGLGYLRYNHDGYGVGNQGRSWPLLSGERALADIARHENPNEHIQVMLNSITPAGMLCEQTEISACPLGWSHAEVLTVARSLSDKKSWYMPRRLNQGYFSNAK